MSRMSDMRARSSWYFLRKKKPTEAEEAAQAAEQRAASLLRQARYWLLAMEKYHNLRSAPTRGFSTTNCTGAGGRHWNHVRLVPSLQRARSITCTAPRDRYPDAVLLRVVIDPLRAEGFKISEMRHHGCGCATFTVQPRKLANG